MTTQSAKHPSVRNQQASIGGRAHIGGKAPSLDTPFDVLLATGCSGGTLAAVRQLGKNGVRAGLISSKMLSASSWSRYTSRTYRGPSEKENEQFLGLLLAIGKASPGQVLLPTSDETAWLYTLHAETLMQYFHLRQPSVESMKRILDKKLLSDAAVRAGLDVLPTWEPRNFCEVVAAAPTLQYPILIKPRTQVHRVQSDKGTVAYTKTELIEKYRTFLSRDHTESEQLDLPDANVPLLQHFVDTGTKGVHSVSGYIDETGELFVTRHARKVFQRSQPAGVGICFESLPTNLCLSESVRRLCLELGYFGIFEVEFISFDDRWAIIDFNPRLFNQAGMDAMRGMPLAMLAYLDAASRTAELRDAVEIARELDNDHPAVFYDRFTLWAILTAKMLSGRAAHDERAYWRDWRNRNREHSVYFAADRRDPLPGVVHAISEVILGFKSFRRFLSSMSEEVPHAQPLIPKVSA